MRWRHPQLAHTPYRPGRPALPTQMEPPRMLSRALMSLRLLQTLPNSTETRRTPAGTRSR